MIYKSKLTKAFFPIRLEILIGFLLVSLVVGTYWQVNYFEFTMFDDSMYVYDNPYIQDGLTTNNIVWALKSFYAANWHPLTWMSHMIDISLYGMNPGGHHFTNVLLHTINALLLFYLFNQMTSNLGASLFIACLFALHPLHTESVAWIAERKDVLSAFWGILAIISYLFFVKQIKLKWYMLVFLFFGASLMSKPIFVTLPFVLLLLDYWPLDRFRLSASCTGRTIHQPRPLMRSGTGLVLEKLPFFLLSACSCIITLFAQKSGGAVATLELFPFHVRIANAMVSYTVYIGKMFWPCCLAVFYPHPGALPLWRVAIAFLTLAAISVIIFQYRRQHPYLIVGWLWYLGMLVPVIGIVQVGSQAMADRYTYLPLIGLFIIVAWGMPVFLAQFRYGRAVLISLAVATVSILMVTTWKQAGYWKNDITLFQHALDVTKNNYMAHNNLGLALGNQENMDGAYYHYYRALQIYPGYAIAHNNMGYLLAQQGKFDEAIKSYFNAIHINSDFKKAHANLANGLSKQNRIAEAIAHYKTVLRLDPYHSEAHLNLGVLFVKQGNTETAIKQFNTVLQIHDGHKAQAHYNLGNILRDRGHIDSAINHYSEAVRTKPDFGKAYNNFGIALIQAGKIHEAGIHFQKALQINPDNKEAYNNLKKVQSYFKQ
jgi:tetratricopeptide (TPR) repeat protein